MAEALRSVVPTAKTGRRAGRREAKAVQDDAAGFEPAHLLCGQVHGHRGLGDDGRREAGALAARGAILQGAAQPLELHGAQGAVISRVARTRTSREQRVQRPARAAPLH